MKILRSRQITQATGLSRTTSYRLEQSGKLPYRRRSSQNSVTWLEAEIQQAWLSERPDVPQHRNDPPTRSTRSGRAFD